PDLTGMPFAGGVPLPLMVGRSTRCAQGGAAPGGPAGTVAAPVRAPTASRPRYLHHSVGRHSDPAWRREPTHQETLASAAGGLSLNPPRIGALCGVLAGQELFGGRRAPHPQGARPRQQNWPAYEGLCWSMRTIAPEARPATASRSASGACASGRVAATWSESSPCARSSTSTSSRAPSARTYTSGTSTPPSRAGGS